MKAMSRMSPPQAGQTSGNASAIRASSLAHAMREVSWESFSGAASAAGPDGAAEAPSPGCGLRVEQPCSTEPSDESAADSSGEGVEVAQGDRPGRQERDGFLG